MPLLFEIGPLSAATLATNFPKKKIHSECQNRVKRNQKQIPVHRHVIILSPAAGAKLLPLAVLTDLLALSSP